MATDTDNRLTVNVKFNNINGDTSITHYVDSSDKF